MSVFREYYYNKQIRNYVKQFMAVFAGMRVQVGWNEDKEPRLISIPIAFASRDRVVAHLLTDNTPTKPLRLPMFSASLSGVEMAPELRKGITTERRKTFMPTGGLFPDDFKVVQQRMPVPYRATMDLHMFASNQDQHMQILEQILMLFDPILQIQTSDDMFDWTQITTIELTGVNLEEVVPIAADRRIIQTTLNFNFPIYISAPVDVHDKYVRDIYVRVGAVSQAADTSEEIIAELDAQGIPYDLYFTLDDIVLPND